MLFLNSQATEELQTNIFRKRTIIKILRIKTYGIQLKQFSKKNLSLKYLCYKARVKSVNKSGIYFLVNFEGCMTNRTEAPRTGTGTQEALNKYLLSK